GNDNTLLREAVATAHALPPSKPPHKELSAALIRVGRDERIATDVRLDALGVAPAAVTTVEAPLFDFLCAQLAGTQPMLVRSSAANVLVKIPLAPAQRLALAEKTK